MSDRPLRHEQVRRVFDDALARAPEDRAAYVADACAGDPGLRREIEQLLAAQAAAASFLSTPAGSGVGAGGRALPPGTRLGPYEIQAVIGAGGMDI